MGHQDLEEYLSRSEVPLEIRIGALLQSGFPPAEFMRLGEILIETANPREKERCAKQLLELSHLVEGRRRRCLQFSD